MQLRARSGLLAACDDRRGFAIELWPFQRKLLRSIEKGPRLHVVAAGRRSGKSTSAALALLWDALLRPEMKEKVRPGERRYSVAVATNLRQSRLVVGAARSLVERSPRFRPLLESATDDELLFRNGSALTAFPCTARGTRGWPISTLVLDEAAHFVDTEGNSAAEQVWTALVPSTLQFGEHARVIVSSTPFGQDGLFASLYQQAASGELRDARAHHATTADANPTIGADVLAVEEARDPDGFKSEYLAAFVGGGMSYLDPDRIADAVTLPSELAPEQGVGWVAGLDPAFSSDPFGLALVAHEKIEARWEGVQTPRLVVGHVRSWKPGKRKPLTFEHRRANEDAVLAEVADVCVQYGARVVTDQYAAAPIVDYLRRRGLIVRTVPMTATSKSEVFAALRARLNTGTLDLYEHGDLLAELRRLRTKFTAGQASVVNPRVGGSHGDLAQALALAVAEQAKGVGVFAHGHSFVGGDLIADTAPWDDSGKSDPSLSPSMRF
jgi:hypothetical protein